MLRISDANGNPVSNGTVEFYEAGTSTPKTVYADKDLSTTLGTVISTDSSGYPKTSGNARTLVFTGTSAFKMIVKDAAGITLVTHDNVPGAVAIPVTDEIALPETPVSSKTSTYTVVAADQGKVINANPTSGSFAITLLSAVTAEDGFRVTIRHAGTANVVTIRSTAGQTIGISGASVTSFSLKSLGEAVQLVSDGGNWYVDGSTPALMQDGLAFFKVTDRLTAPPSSPVGGARYIINGTPTGVWSTLSYAQHDVVESDGNGSWFRYTPAEGWLAYVEDENLYTAFVGTAWADQTGMSTPSTSTLKMGIWLDQRADGTSTGSTTTGAWTTHTLQTEAANSITGASLASNKITLPAGTYNVDADGVFSRSDAGQLRLRLETAGTIFYGINGVSGSGADGTHGSQVVATFTLASADNLILEYYLQTNSSGNALGTAMGIASNLETYAYVRVLSLTALQGPIGEDGPQGNDGLDAAFPYTWSTATSGDPGSGKILGNNATIASITQINVSETDSAGGSMAAVLATWDDSTSSVKGLIRISKEGATSNFHHFKISGSGTDAGSYWTFPVTYVATSGTISNGDALAVLVVEKGDKGETGATGSTGSAGSTGATGPNVGLDYQWSTATSGDPGTGKVLVNNATPSSATVLHISESNRQVASQAGYIATWDDSTTTSARGVIRILDVSNPGTNFLEYMITGSLTDAGGYDTFPVSYVGGAGTIANNSIVSIMFNRTGDVGAGTVPYGTTTTINVPSDYATISLAWDAIRNWVINGTVIIQVADGTYPITSTLTLEHPFGENIRLIGNTATPANCVIRVSTAISAIYVGDGCSIDLINGFRIYHDTLAARASTAGVLADRGASVKCGASVVVDGFYWGFYARRDGYIEALDTTATNCGDAGYHALNGGVIDADGATATNNNDSANGLGSGFVAENGEITANDATATGNWLHGFSAIQNGTIKCTNATAGTCTTGSGFYADTGGQMYADGSVSDGNGQYGYCVAAITSQIEGTITNPGTANASGLFAPYIEYFYSSQPGLRVVSPSTNDAMRHDTKGTGSHFFNVNGSAKFRVTNSAVTSDVVLTPTTTDGAALGTTSLMWSDLFLASGGVINFNSGDVTITHSANTLSFAGASSGYAFDAAITVGGATVWNSANDGAGSGLDADTVDGANIGTSGGTIPLLNTANTWSAAQTISVAGLGLTTTNTTDAASVQVFRVDGDRAAPTSGDEAYASTYMSDTSGTQREAVRLTALAADAIGASWRTQLLISLATGGSLGAYYRLSTTALSPITNDVLALGTTTNGWADYYGASGHRFYFANSVFWTSGSGTPESVVTAPVGSLYTRSDGGASTTLYIKESGTGNTGWVAK